jgi:hypothetical protein
MRPRRRPRRERRHLYSRSANHRPADVRQAHEPRRDAFELPPSPENDIARMQSLKNFGAARDYLRGLRMTELIGDSH